MFDQNVQDLGVMPLQNAQKLAEAAGFNLYFTETEEEPPTAIFTTKNQSRELGQNSLKHKSEPRSVVATPKPSANSNQTLDSKHSKGPKRNPDPPQDASQQSDKKTNADRPKFTLVPEDPD